MLASFVAWHLHLGFKRIYLYFDDAADDSVLLAKKLRREAMRRGYGDDAVRVLPCDSALRSQWSQLTMAHKWDGGLDKVVHHVEVRQLLNCEHALRTAHTDGDIDWLLHIDSDELFSIDDLDAAAHFGRLSAHGCVNYRYPIHEGCPEALDSDNVFASVTLFRRHLRLIEDETQWADSDADARAAAARAFYFWRDDGRQYHLGSPQGKSATRVMPGALPFSVHAFAPPDARLMPKCFAGFRDGQDAYGESARVVSPMGRPCILHYIACDFTFWHRKYELLGDFSNHKPGGAAVGGEVDPQHFHAQSRDLVRRCGADRAAARAAYSQQVCLLDAEEAARQVAAQVCLRVHAVRDTLQALNTPSRWPGMAVA